MSSTPSATSLPAAFLAPLTSVINVTVVVPSLTVEPPPIIFFNPAVVNFSLLASARVLFLNLLAVVKSAEDFTLSFVLTAADPSAVLT